MMQWPISVALAAVLAVLLVNVTATEDYAKSMYRDVSAMANSQKYTQAQLDALEIKLQPKLDYRFSEQGVIQPQTAGVVNNIRPLIVGGSEAAPGQFPWQAFLYYEWSIFCGGSLIQPQWVLTAAHCTNIITFNVHVGTIYQTQTDPSRQVIKMSKVYNHPGYNSTYLHNDIALVKLQTPFILNDFVKLIKLPLYSESTSTFADTTAITSGLGRISYPDGIIPARMKFTPLTVLSPAQCASVYPWILQSVVCTNSSINTSTCFGDSGGPLVYQSPNGNWTLIGVTSFGVGCGSWNHPAGFARVSSFLGWIDETIQNGTDPVQSTTTPPTSTSISTTTTTTTTSAPDITARQWPWHVYVYGDGWYMCSGSLIKPQWVLTTAQCAALYSTFTIHLGTDRREQIEASRQVINTTEKYVHPLFRRTYLENNLALLKLPNAVTLGNKINIIPLPTIMESRSFLEAQTIASGFDQNSTQPDKLLYKNLTVISNAICTMEYNTNVVKPSKICTNPITDINTIHGTVGGPLVYTNPDGSRLMIGVASSTMGPEYPSTPALFERVTSFTEWIENITMQAQSSTAATTTTVTTTTSTTTTPTTTTPTTSTPTTSTPTTVTTTTNPTSSTSTTTIKTTTTSTPSTQTTTYIPTTMNFLTTTSVIIVPITSTTPAIITTTPTTTSPKTSATTQKAATGKTTTKKTTPTKKTTTPKPINCAKASFDKMHDCCTNGPNPFIVFVSKTNKCIGKALEHSYLNVFLINKLQNSKNENKMVLNDNTAIKTLAIAPCHVNCVLKENGLLDANGMLDNSSFVNYVNAKQNAYWAGVSIAAFANCSDAITKTYTLGSFKNGCSGHPLAMMQCIQMKLIQMCPTSDRDTKKGCSVSNRDLFEKCSSKIYNGNASLKTFNIKTKVRG